MCGCCLCWLGTVSRVVYPRCWKRTVARSIVGAPGDRVEGKIFNENLVDMLICHIYTFQFMGIRPSMDWFR
jgi:hypothetical protein